MRDVLETLERWAADGTPVAIATVVGTERSAPREPGAVLAVSAEGEVAGSVTGGCVEPAVYGEARDVLAGGAPRLKTYGIADDEAFEVGLPAAARCTSSSTGSIRAGRAHRRGRARGAPDRPRDRAHGRERRRQAARRPEDDGPAGELLARGETAIIDTPKGRCSSPPSRPGRTCTSSEPSTTPLRSPRSAASSATG